MKSVQHSASTGRTAHSEIASSWVQRWSHLIPSGGTVLDLACGEGRHMQWFSERGHPVTGIDRSVESSRKAARFGEVIVADVENGAWPLNIDADLRQFSAVIITHYLWRPLFPLISQSLAPNGVLLYETFSSGNETVGKPSNPNFILRPGELLTAFQHLRIVAYEDGFLDGPPRFIQRLAAVRTNLLDQSNNTPQRFAL